MNPVINKDGIKRWYNGKGEYHKLDGPAVEHNNGHKEWWVNGKLHRIDGPALEFASGYKAWYENGKYHKLNGPAIEHADGSKFWRVNGKRHRIDGPACEFAEGEKYWHLNDKELSEDLHTKLTVEDIKGLPLYLGLGFDDYISERLR